VSFSGVHALKGVDLELEQGQIMGLIGPNGAGKTTLIDAVTGIVGASGRVTLGDEDVSSLRPDQRASRGLARTWQNAELFDDLSVREHLTVALRRQPLSRIIWNAVRRTDEARTEDVGPVLELLDIVALAEALPRELTEGQRKLVGVARALAGQPRVICLDEPAAGLDTAESAEFGRVLRRIVESGVSLLLVEHDVGLVMDVCDAVTVLEFGQVIAHGTPAEVSRHSDVIRAYLGSHAKAASNDLPANDRGASR
jgi:branched-chain amino acid transport system ATP-binding protein